MDLAVTGLKISDRYQMIEDMMKLALFLENWKFLEEFKYISTAAIPVIKMKINLEKLRE